MLLIDPAGCPAEVQELLKRFSLQPVQCFVTSIAVVLVDSAPVPVLPVQVTFRLLPSVLRVVDPIDAVVNDTGNFPLAGSRLHSPAEAIEGGINMRALAIDRVRIISFLLMISFHTTKQDGLPRFVAAYRKRTGRFPGTACSVRALAQCRGTGQSTCLRQLLRTNL